MELLLLLLLGFLPQTEEGGSAVLIILYRTISHGLEVFVDLGIDLSTAIVSFEILLVILEWKFQVEIEEWGFVVLDQVVNLSVLERAIALDLLFLKFEVETPADSHLALFPIFLLCAGGGLRMVSTDIHGSYLFFVKKSRLLFIFLLKLYFAINYIALMII